MDIAILHYRINDDGFSYKIFNLLTNKLDHSSELFIITLYNLAIYESIKGLDDKALETINRAIEFSNKYRITSSLHLCYYEKALMEYNLNNENYKNSFEICRNITIANNNYDFLKFLEEKIKKYT